jgi:hypothetical protein
MPERKTGVFRFSALPGWSRQIPTDRFGGQFRDDRRTGATVEAAL